MSPELPVGTSGLACAYNIVRTSEGTCAYECPGCRAGALELGVELMSELLTTLQHLGSDLLSLILVLARLIAPWWLALVWIAWWLWAVDWRKLWPRLAEGGWAPLTLFGIMIALVWSSIASGPLELGNMALANFWWQLLAVAAMIGSALFVGWLQGVLGCYPAEVALEAPAADGHGHSDHDHGHASQ